VSSDTHDRRIGAACSVRKERMLAFGASRGKRPWCPCQGKKMLVQADPGAMCHVSASARART
jgi:hypothetical protein